MDQLYRAVIMERSASPKYQGVIDDATHHYTLLNPSCGDTVIVYLSVNSEGIVEAIRFNGEGCAISIASADIMAEVLMGQSLSDAREIVNDFNLLVQGKLTNGAAHLGEAQALAGVAQFPARIRCAQLAWKAFELALDSSND